MGGGRYNISYYVKYLIVFLKVVRKGEKNEPEGKLVTLALDLFIYWSVTVVVLCWTVDYRARKVTCAN